MIPQLDLRNFFLTGIFIIIYFVIFMWMIKLIFLSPIEKHIKAYKDQLGINKIHYEMCIRYTEKQQEEIKEREKNINQLIENTQQEMMYELESQIIEYEKTLKIKREKILEEMKKELNITYSKENILEYIRRYYDNN